MINKLICKIIGHIYTEDVYFVRKKLSSGHCKRCKILLEINEENKNEGRTN